MDEIVEVMVVVCVDCFEYEVVVVVIEVVDLYWCFYWEVFFECVFCDYCVWYFVGDLDVVVVNLFEILLVCFGLVDCYDYWDFFDVGCKFCYVDEDYFIVVVVVVCVVVVVMYDV